MGQKLNEGKTKQIFELVDQPGLVLVQSKDQITAGNAVRKDQMEGKAAIANKTTSCVFKLLQESGEDPELCVQLCLSDSLRAHVLQQVRCGAMSHNHPGATKPHVEKPLGVNFTANYWGMFLCVHSLSETFSVIAWFVYGILKASPVRTVCSKSITRSSES